MTGSGILCSRGSFARQHIRFCSSVTRNPRAHSCCVRCHAQPGQTCRLRSCRIGDTHLHEGLREASAQKRGREHVCRAAASAEAGSRSSAAWALLPVTIMFGVANRVTAKMAVVPMADHVFFLALLQTFSYVVVYSLILITRYRMGIITEAMMRCARVCKHLFVAIGSAEAIAAVLLLMATKQLPGAILPLLQKTWTALLLSSASVASSAASLLECSSARMLRVHEMHMLSVFCELQQSVVIWNFLLSAVILRRKFHVTEVMGALLVVSGVVLASQPTNAAAAAVPLAPDVLAQVDPRYALLFVCSCCLPAVATIVKEKIFRLARAELDGKPLDIFVVNTFGSCAQMIGTILLLPILAAQQNITMSGMPAYIANGARCFASNPALPVIYLCCNLALNICALTTLRMLGATTLILGMSSVIPLTIWVFTFDLPYVGAGTALGATFLKGAALILAGIVLYNFRKLKPKTGLDPSLDSGLNSDLADGGDFAG